CSEDAELALEPLRVAEAVPDVGVLRDDTQRLLLAATADQYRDLAGRRRVESVPAGLDDGQVLRERVEPLARRAELVAVLLVVVLEPSGAGTEDEAADARALRTD